MDFNYDLIRAYERASWNVVINGIIFDSTGHYLAEWSDEFGQEYLSACEVEDETFQSS